MNIMINVPFNLLDALIYAGKGFEINITTMESDDTHTMLHIPIETTYQIEFLQFVKKMLDKFDNSLKNKDK